MSMKKIMLLIRSIFAYVFVGGILFICIIPCFFIASLPARWRYDNPVYFWFINLFYRVINWALFLPITIEGKENLSYDPAIYVANHQSSLDIPLLGSLVNGNPHFWLFWVRFAKIPFFGFILRRMNIVVDPSGLRKLVSSINKALDMVKKTKSHIIIFPEGGRYIDGRVHNFFYGFAILAKKTGRPVIPVAIFNVNKIYPPGAFLLALYPIRIIIGKPFFFQPDETESDFVQRVHAWFIEKTAE